MAVPFVENYNGDGSNRIFTPINTILSESHIRVDFYYEDVIGSGIFTDHNITSANWDIINNSVVFVVAPTDGYLVKISVSSDGEGLDAAPSEITNVAVELPKIINLSDNMDAIKVVYDVQEALAELYAERDKLYEVQANLVQIQFNSDNITIIAEAEQNAILAQLRVWDAEANALTARSAAEEDNDVLVKRYSSNDDGTFSSVDTEYYSAKHWQVEAQSVVGDDLINSIAANTEGVILNVEAIANLASAKGRLVNTSLPSIPDIGTTPTVIDFTENVPSTASDLFTIDDTLNEITVHKNASLNFMSSVLFESNVVGDVNVTFNLIDIATNVVLVTQTTVVNIPVLETESIALSTLLTVGRDTIPEAPLTFRIEAVADIAGMALKTFESVIAVSADYDLQANIDHAAIIGGIVDMTQGERLGIIETSKDLPSYSRVGELVMTTGIVPFGDCIKADGTLYKREDAPELWAYAQASGNLTTETEWSATSKFAYSDGDGLTTFRVPDYRGEFVRGFDDGAGIDLNRVFGREQTDIMRSHNHGIGGTWRPIFAAGTNSWGYYMSGSIADNDNYKNNKTNATIGGNETRPRNGTVMYCIKYK